MTLIPRETRDKVIEISEKRSESERMILCDLNGIPYEFFKEYLHVAEFEKRFFENGCVMTSVTDLSEDNKFESIRIEFVDMLKRDEILFNRSFGIYSDVPYCEQFDVETIVIGKHCYSEWLIDMFKSFSDNFNSTLYGNETHTLYDSLMSSLENCNGTKEIPEQVHI